MLRAPKPWTCFSLLAAEEIKKNGPVWTRLYSTSKRSNTTLPDWNKLTSSATCKPVNESNTVSKLQVLLMPLWKSPVCVSILRDVQKSVLFNNELKNSTDLLSCSSFWHEMNANREHSDWITNILIMLEEGSSLQMTLISSSILWLLCDDKSMSRRKKAINRS